MQKILVATALSLWSLSASAQCSTSHIGSSTFTSCADGTSIQSQKIGNSTWTTGRAGSQGSVDLTTQKIGNSTWTTGTVGGQRYDTTTMQIGNSTWTTGTLGTKRIDSTTNNYGTSTITYP